MAENSLITQEQYNEDMKRLYDEKIYPFLNGATHTGCVPLGTILPYFGETAPTHFLICNGTEYAKADYPELAEHLLALTDPTPYAGSDANHFKVPDLRGEFLRGAGTNGHSGEGNGANVGVHQSATEHSKIVFNPSTGDTQFCVAQAMDSNYKSVRYADVQHSPKTYVSTTFSNKSTDTGTGAYTARPTNTSVTYIIAYRNAYIDLALDSFPIDISQPTDGQLLMYDATAGRWVNGGHKYSTDEHVVGTWIDGKPIYEKTIQCIAPTVQTDGTLVEASDFTIVSEGVSQLIKLWFTIKGFTNPIGSGQQVLITNAGRICKINVDANGSVLCIKPVSDGIVFSNKTLLIVVQYTKTTDTV